MVILRCNLGAGWGRGAGGREPARGRGLGGAGGGLGVAARGWGARGRGWGLVAGRCGLGLAEAGGWGARGWGLRAGVGTDGWGWGLGAGVRGWGLAEGLGPGRGRGSLLARGCGQGLGAGGWGVGRLGDGGLELAWARGRVRGPGGRGWGLGAGTRLRHTRDTRERFANACERLRTLANASRTLRERFSDDPWSTIGPLDPNL